MEANLSSSAAGPQPAALTGATREFTGELFPLEPSAASGDRRLSRAGLRDSVYRRYLGLSDLVSVVLALVLTAEMTQTAAVYWSMFASVLVVVPACKVAGLYDRDAHVLNKTTLDELPNLFVVAVLVAVGAFIARDLLVAGLAAIGSKQLVFMTLSLFVLLAAGRLLARRIARQVTPAERLLVIGDAAGCDNLRRQIAANPSIRALVAGRLPLSEDELPHGASRVLGRPGELRKVVDLYEIDRIVVVPEGRDPDEFSDVIRAVKSFGVKISLMPRLFDAIGGAMEADDIGGAQLMGVRDFRMTASSNMLKRWLDVSAAAASLLIFAPLLVVAALAIRLDSSGGVFYRQPRIGRDGKQFEIIKFRTMRSGADDERGALQHLNETTGLFKVTDDPRITRIGRFLRESHIDELPQLINVLRGDMSLVGPRPLVPEEDKNITGWYRRRSNITPGITGVWQLLGPVRIPLDEMVKLDYVYVANWSLWEDLKILMRTVPHVLGRRGL
ncbi:MAG: sugar transferase [Solirubrobacterales bacterium]